jgi:8-oxo-dGTP pyrophosphatase MutT (NUDIX family)
MQNIGPIDSRETNQILNRRSFRVLWYVSCEICLNDKSRPECTHKKPVLVDISSVFAAALLLNEKKAGFLFVENWRKDGNCWGFPGGKTEPRDETPLATLLREFGEEVGYQHTDSCVNVHGGFIGVADGSLKKYYAEKRKKGVHGARVKACLVVLYDLGIDYQSLLGRQECPLLGDTRCARFSSTEEVLSGHGLIPHIRAFVENEEFAGKIRERASILENIMRQKKAKNSDNSYFFVGPNLIERDPCRAKKLMDKEVRKDPLASGVESCSMWELYMINLNDIYKTREDHLKELIMIR